MCLLLAHLPSPERPCLSGCAVASSRPGTFHPCMCVYLLEPVGHQCEFIPSALARSYPFVCLCPVVLVLSKSIYGHLSLGMSQPSPGQAPVPLY